MDLTLEAAVKDAQTVLKDATPLAKIPDGMRIRPAPLHADERGSITEIFSRNWDWDHQPLDHLYMFTIRPGVSKGWGLHKKQEDRYFLISGDVQLVMYDVRPDSSTYGRVMTLVMSEKNRRLITIPAFVWHADVNLGTTEAQLINMPTVAFNAEDPDKYRLPLDTPLIPYDFGTMRGW